MSPLKLILATRSSPLALYQSNWVKQEIERLVNGVTVDILTIKTTGDRLSTEPLSLIGGKGLFTKEIEEALLDRKAHLAVHSLKDLPTDTPDGLILAAIPRREDPRDVLISRDGKRFADFPKHALIGTSSVRRSAQLKLVRPDLRIEPLRGNLDTRLRKLHQGQSDAIVLAAAGLRRLGLEDQITEYFTPELLCPAVGQGALAVQARQDDEDTIRVLSHLEDLWARVSTTAERALLHRLGGGCQVPIAAITQQQQDRIHLSAVVIHPDGTQIFRASELSAPINWQSERNEAIRIAEALGRTTAENLLAQGAGKILELSLQINPLTPPHIA